MAEFLGPERAFALKEAWQGLFAEQAMFNWMLERGLDLRWADKLRYTASGLAMRWNATRTS